MPLFDAQNLFTAKAGDSVGSTTTATTYSTNVIDLGSGFDRNIGPGTRIKIAGRVVSSYSTSETATLAVTLQTSADNSSFSDLQTVPAASIGSMLVGYKFNLDFPETGVKRYNRLKYVTSTTTSTTLGKIVFKAILDTQTNY